MKFLPSLTRVIALNGLAAVLVLGTSFYALSPFFWPGSPWAGKGPVYQKPPLGRLALEFLKGQRDFEHLITLVPLMIFTLMATAFVLFFLLHMRETPKYVELLPDGVRLGRWVAGDRFIPYHQIADIYERSQVRNLAGAAICIIVFGGQKFCILKYAYPDWPALYQETQRRIGPA
jgi:hypothetical protein